MAKGQLPRAYLRIDPNIDAHADPEAMVLLMVWANRQPRRGRFKGLEAVVRVLGHERVEAAKARGDLVQLEDGAWYLEGWDVWQEGDLDVGARMRKLRAKRKGVTSDESDTEPRVTPTVTAPSLPSEASRRLGVEALGTTAAAATTTRSMQVEGGVGGGDPADPAPPREARDQLVQASLAIARVELAGLAARVASHPFGGGDPQQLLLAASKTAGGAAFAAPEGCSSPAWAAVTRDKLLAFELENRTRAHRSGVRWAPVAAADRGPPGSTDCAGDGLEPESDRT